MPENSVDKATKTLQENIVQEQPRGFVRRLWDGLFGGTEADINFHIRVAEKKAAGVNNVETQQTSGEAKRGVVTAQGAAQAAAATQTIGAQANADVEVIHWQAGDTIRRGDAATAHYEFKLGVDGKAYAARNAIDTEAYAKRSASDTALHEGRNENTLQLDAIQKAADGKFYAQVRDAQGQYASEIYEAEGRYYAHVRGEDGRLYTAQIDQKIVEDWNKTGNRMQEDNARSDMERMHIRAEGMKRVVKDVGDLQNVAHAKGMHVKDLRITPDKAQAKVSHRLTGATGQRALAGQDRSLAI